MSFTLPRKGTPAGPGGKGRACLTCNHRLATYKTLTAEMKTKLSSVMKAIVWCQALRITFQEIAARQRKKKLG
jgi:hypothetical protein